MVRWTVNFAIGFCLATTESCGQNQCPDQVTGACGLEGACLQCLTDADCSGGAALRSSSARTSVCTDDADCPPDQVCLDAMCVRPQRCSLAGECVELTQRDPGLGVCQPDGVCDYQRCTPQGTCPSGTVPVPGSLACVPAA